MRTLTARRRFLRSSLIYCAALTACACGSATVAPTLVYLTEAVGTGHPVTPTSVIELSPTAVPSPSSMPVPVAEGLSEIPFALPLTTQHVTGTTAVFYFELAQPAEGMLIYQTADGGSGEQIALFDASTATRQMTLEGLNPGATYQLSVVVKDSDGLYRTPGFLGEAWADVSFRTWGDHQPIRFAVIGDSGFGDSVTPRLSEQMAASNLDFVLQAGDIVYHVDENKDPFQAFALKYYRPFSQVLHQIPIYPVIGNHDDENTTIWNGEPFYEHAFPPISDPQFPPIADNDWYAFAYGDVQFLMLNTEAMNVPHLRADQKVWLAERLADTRFSLSIPVFHVTPFSAGLHPNDGVAVQADWVPLFEQAGVKLVMAGHDHNYQRFNVNGITYLVSGGGSATTYEQTVDAPGLQVFNRVSHFVVFEVYPDRVDFKAVALGGDVIDQLSIPR